MLSNLQRFFLFRGNLSMPTLFSFTSANNVAILHKAFWCTIRMLSKGQLCDVWPKCLSVNAAFKSQIYKPAVYLALPLILDWQFEVNNRPSKIGQERIQVNSGKQVDNSFKKVGALQLLATVLPVRVNVQRGGYLVEKSDRLGCTFPLQHWNMILTS